MVNRLQQPTHSYLARSRSAMSLSGDQSGPTAPSLSQPGEEPQQRESSASLRHTPEEDHRNDAVSEDPGNLRPVRITPENSQPSTPTAASKEEEKEEHIFRPPLPRPQPLGQNKPSNEQVATTPAGATGQS
ncbi:hypothetical protein XENOCAPTIV_014622 [Xenoophorus captivus]|uniref:Uncharacterized protein n=1 Tax=Xenoophorus captivus TaxID=1517983 RepID=A0ABV0S931_9TELE